MLFWIFVFLLTRQSSLTQGHPNLLSRAATEASCDCTVNSCRTLFDIIWGCLATIFACTWVALHQNVPDPNLGWFSLLMRKLRMMLVTIIAPEMVVGFAARQLVSAWWIAKEFDVSTTHGFFCNMGGFVSEEGHPVSSIKQVPAYILAIQKIKKADIEDKSKGDTLSKGVAIAQGLWFVTQCLARVSQHLPLTELEVSTLAFAVLSVIIRLLWLHKPLDVQQPIVVARSEVEMDPLQEEDITPPSDSVTLSDRISGISGIHDYYHPISSTSVPSLYSIEIGTKKTRKLINVAGVLGVGSIFGSIHCATWNALFPSMAEMWIWRISSVCIAADPVLIALLALAANEWAPDNGTAKTVLLSFILFGLVVYPICRLFLIILSFTTLRSLPPSAFVDVNWSNYMPHL
ncbi:hypothetical protein B0H16DRAFT_780753 [Mycena metata]|uniref:Uncharacterized protein n=1 Tax=Mycena metata TaxID=1033252 RepID=A0AAD7IY85_9AGAR|nr:hypothetical protein B0H16DRAFT_780753 [Mycena metata]